METKARREVRSTTQVILSLKPDDAERFRASAKTLRDESFRLPNYLAAPLNGEELLPIPPTHARIGNCIVSAIAELQRPSANLPGAIALLCEAQGFGVEFARLSPG